MLPDGSKPENRNYEDLILVPLLLGFLAVVFAVVTVFLTATAAFRRQPIHASELVPAGGSVLVLLAFAAWRFIADALT